MSKGAKKQFSYCFLAPFFKTKYSFTNSPVIVDKLCVNN